MSRSSDRSVNVDQRTAGVLTGSGGAAAECEARARWRPWSRPRLARATGLLPRSRTRRHDPPTSLWSAPTQIPSTPTRASRQAGLQRASKCARSTTAPGTNTAPIPVGSATFKPPSPRPGSRGPPVGKPCPL